MKEQKAPDEKAINNQPQKKEMTHQEFMTAIRVQHAKTQQKARNLTTKIIYNDKGR